jgi:hypothetical protein
MQLSFYYNRRTKKKKRKIIRNKISKQKQTNNSYEYFTDHTVISQKSAFVFVFVFVVVFVFVFVFILSRFFFFWSKQVCIYILQVHYLLIQQITGCVHYYHFPPSPSLSLFHLAIATSCASAGTTQLHPLSPQSHQPPLPPSLPPPNLYYYSLLLRKYSHYFLLHRCHCCQPTR